MNSVQDQTPLGTFQDWSQHLIEVGMLNSKNELEPNKAHFENVKPNKPLIVSTRIGMANSKNGVELNTAHLLIKLKMSNQTEAFDYFN